MFLILQFPFLIQVRQQALRTFVQLPLFISVLLRPRTNPLAIQLNVLIPFPFHVQVLKQVPRTFFNFLMPVGILLRPRTTSLAIQLNIVIPFRIPFRFTIQVLNRVR